MVICLRMGKTYTVKIPSGDFQVTTPEIPLLSQQAVTSKEISVLYTNLQLYPYPNTQLDLFCSDNFPLWCTTPKYVTNQSMHGSKYVTNHQLEKDIGCKVLQFINTMKITKHLDYKTLWRTNVATSWREKWTRANFLRSQYACEIFLHQVTLFCISCDDP